MPVIRIETVILLDSWCISQYTEFAMANYGSKYADLDEEKQKIVREAVPQSISEAEPKDVSKKR